MSPERAGARRPVRFTPPETQICTKPETFSVEPPFMLKLEAT